MSFRPKLACMLHAARIATRGDLRQGIRAGSRGWNLFSHSSNGPNPEAGLACMTSLHPSDSSARAPSTEREIDGK